MIEDEIVRLMTRNTFSPRPKWLDAGDGLKQTYFDETEGQISKANRV